MHNYLALQVHRYLMKMLSINKLKVTIGSYKTTKDIFQKQLHAYTITHAIDDRNVLRFHIDYFKAEKKVEIGNNTA